MDLFSKTKARKNGSFLKICMFLQAAVLAAFLQHGKRLTWFHLCSSGDGQGGHA